MRILPSYSSAVPRPAYSCLNIAWNTPITGSYIAFIQGCLFLSCRVRFESRFSFALTPCRPFDFYSDSGESPAIFSARRFPRFKRHAAFRAGAGFISYHLRMHGAGVAVAFGPGLSVRRIRLRFCLMLVTGFVIVFFQIPVRVGQEFILTSRAAKEICLTIIIGALRRRFVDGHSAYDVFCCHLILLKNVQVFE